MIVCDIYRSIAAKSDLEAPFKTARHLLDFLTARKTCSPSEPTEERKLGCVVASSPLVPRHKCRLFCCKFVSSPLNQICCNSRRSECPFQRMMTRSFPFENTTKVEVLNPLGISFFFFFVFSSSFPFLSFFHLAPLG